MKRIPGYLVIALLGLVFISAGLITMFADNSDGELPSEPAAVQPSPTLTETPTMLPTVYVAAYGSDCPDLSYRGTASGRVCSGSCGCATLTNSDCRGTATADHGSPNRNPCY